MKKLMIAAVAIACAMVASAASYDWKTSATGKIYVSGGASTIASGTAYIFDSSTVSQLAVLQNFYDYGTMLSGSKDDKAISAGKIAGIDAAAFEAGSTIDAFVATIVGKEIFISDIVSAEGLDVGFKLMSFNLKDDSMGKATALESKPTTFDGAGWYTKSSEPTPEPTSAMLMLLGMAGLALRRRRA